MATTTTPTPFSCVQPGLRLLTVADVAAMPEQLPSGPVSFELHHGRLVAMSPPGARHGELQSALAAELVEQGAKKKYGVAYTEVGVVLQRSPDHVVGPDVAFVAARSLPVRESPEGFLETIPELVVEVRSKNDSSADIERKVADYLKAGVQLVWVVDPVSETIAEHAPENQLRTLSKGDTLRCEAIIPGFELSLADLFRQ